MSTYHEPVEELQPQDRDIHRALNSLKEEIEAIDWYHQRVVTSTDPELKSIVAHNRDEEIEHACMALEWLRRHIPTWDMHLRTYLFTSGSVTELEARAAEEEATETPSAIIAGDLGIGSLKQG
jgi:ferritin-like protein